jgi:hypothetical protein
MGIGSAIVRYTGALTGRSQGIASSLSGISLQIMAAQMERKKLELDNKPSEAEAEELRRFEDSEQRRYYNELISYGTKKALAPATQPKWKQHLSQRQQQNQPNIFGQIRNFFQGK